MGSTNPDYNLHNLTQLLNHLERNFTATVAANDDDGDDDEQLVQASHKTKSPFERQRIRANFEHARALLLRLEHDSTSIKVASRKQAIQADLRAKRDQIKKLQLRVQALDDVTESSSSESEDDSELDDEEKDDQGGKNGDDVRADYASNDGGQHQSNLRKRTGNTGDAAAAYSTGVQGARGASTSANDDDDGKATNTREKILTTDRKEQEQIMDSLLALTRELKTSASLFQGSLESEKTVLDKASKGLDRNVDGMDAAGKRMGTLRKMTEGKGFFARLKLYGMIAGLWLVALVMVFVLPKLRF